MEDKLIVESLLRGGNTQLFSLVVEKYESVVFAKVLGITKNTDTACELTQQTFVRAYLRLADWHGRELGPWLVAIACHLSLNYLEQERRRRSVSADVLSGLTTEEYSEEREQRLQTVEQAIARLPEADREVIRLYYYNKVKTAELAERLGQSQSNVLVRLHRIRERLKKLLQYGENE